MRKILLIIGLLLLFAAGAGAGYLYAIRYHWGPGDKNARDPNADGKGPADGLYTDEEVAVMRKKLAALPLPISVDSALVLLGIDRARIENAKFLGAFGGGQGNGNESHHWSWRLSPRFALAMHQEYGPDFRPAPPGYKPGQVGIGGAITRIEIGKAVPSPGNPQSQVEVDKKDNDKTETELPKIKTGKARRWEDWKYPNITKTVASWYDPDEVAGGFVALTADEFDKVARYYYEKCHVPNGAITLARSPHTTPDGNKLEYLMFRGFNSAAQAGLPAGQVRFLNVKTPAYTVSIVVVQPQGQKETQIFVNLW
jgi:hypothetical protein